MGEPARAGVVEGGEGALGELLRGRRVAGDRTPRVGAQDRGKPAALLADGVAPNARGNSGGGARRFPGIASRTLQALRPNLQASQFVVLAEIDGLRVRLFRTRFRGHIVP